MIKFFPLLFFFCLAQTIVNAQPFFPEKGPVYDDTVISRIDILIAPDSLRSILAPGNEYSDYEYPATFIFLNGTLTDTLKNVGFCLRGNTSRTSKKKSFKISFNTFNKGRKFKSFEKLNLNGEHNDPSIIRSKLYWESMRSMNVPATYANHVALYINGEYKGLYISVEHIDENFLKKRFGNNDGNLYKCLNMADLEYRGETTVDYKHTVGSRQVPVYELKTNKEKDDYSDLVNFIKVLNQTSNAAFQEKLEAIFNVNSFLRAYAVDVATGNWDNYAYNSNNYYLYHNSETGKFEFIPYDSDNSYGIDWVGRDWGTRDMYNWEKNGGTRKLVSRLLYFQEYKDRFSFFTNQFQAGMGNPAVIFPIIDNLLAKIKTFAQNDIYRTYDYGYTYTDFTASYTTSLGGHVDYGLKPFISARYNATKAKILLNTISPVLSELRHMPTRPYFGDTIYFKVRVEDDKPITNVSLYYRLDGGTFTSMLLYDDGLYKDVAAGDGYWSTWLIPAPGTKSIEYYTETTDMSANIALEPRTGFAAILLTSAPKLVINELMASNTTIITDEYGECDDWIEIYNNDSRPIALKEMRLSDNPLKPGKYNFPDITLQPGGFLLVWADDQEEQGELHANFKLNALGEKVGLYENRNGRYQLLDTMSYSELIEDVSIGSPTDGIKPFGILPFATPGRSNAVMSINEQGATKTPGLHAFPNPASDICNLELLLTEPSNAVLTLTDLTGRDQGIIFNGFLNAGTRLLHFSIADLSLSLGIYFLRLNLLNQKTFIQRKLVVIER